MAWVILVIAGLLEIGWAIGLKHSDGLTRPWSSAATIAAMVASMWLLAIAVRSLPVGTAYAVWTGIGTVGHGRGGHPRAGRAGHAGPARLHRAHRRRHRRPEDGQLIFTRSAIFTGRLLDHALPRRDPGQARHRAGARVRQAQVVRRLDLLEDQVLQARVAAAVAAVGLRARRSSRACRSCGSARCRCPRRLPTAGARSRAPRGGPWCR